MQAFILDQKNTAILNLIKSKINAILESKIICEEDVHSIRHEVAHLDMEDKDKIEI